ncbi:MAG: upsA [Bacillales bacterium]|nr:upsA [Bacillales bacterium]
MHLFIKDSAYRTLIHANIWNQLGDNLFNIVFVIFAASLNYHVLAVSLVSFITVIPAISQVLTGYLADNTRHKIKSLQIGKLFQTLLFIGITLLIAKDNTFIIFLLILLFKVISDIIGSYAEGLEIPLLKINVEDKDLNEAFSFSTAVSHMINIVGQAAGASLIILLSYDYKAFGLINTVTFIIAALILFIGNKRINEDPFTKSSTAEKNSHSFFKNFLGSFKEVYVGLKQKPGIASTFIIFSAINVLGSASDGLINLGLLHNEHFWLINYGYTVGAANIVFSIGLILGSLLIHDFLNKLSFPKLVGILAFLIAIMAVNFVMLKSIWILLSCNFLVAYLLGKIGPRFTSNIVSATEETHLAATMGIINTVLVFGAPIGQIIFLGLANIASINIAWIIYGISSIGICSTSLLLRVPKKNSKINQTSEL